MFSEILVDHTSIHALARRPTTAENLPRRSREILQIIEQLLLADTIWICDSVTAETMDATMNFLGRCVRAGLTNARNEGLFRIAPFPPDSVAAACETAAPMLWDVVSKLSPGELKGYGPGTLHPLRPAGAQSLAYPNLAKMKFGSLEAEEYKLKAMAGKGWLPSSALPFLSSDLYGWFAEAVRTAPFASDSLWEIFNTLSRWAYNEQLAHQISKQTNTVQYAPSYGRAAIIDAVHSGTWIRSLEFFERRLSSNFRNDPDFLKSISEVAPTMNSRLPIFALWIISRLPEQPTLDHLLAQIAMARKDPRVIDVRALLRKWEISSSADIPEKMADEVFEETKRRFPSGFKNSDGGNPLKWRVVTKLPLVPKVMTLESSREYSGSTPAQKKIFLRNLFHPARTLLTGFITDGLGSEDVSSLILERLKSLIAA